MARIKLSVLGLSLLLLASCLQPAEPVVIVITATFLPPTEMPESVPTAVPPPVSLSLSPVPDIPLSNPTPDPTRPSTRFPQQVAQEHVVQPGDTLSGIASRYNVSLNVLLRVNSLENPNILSLGQVIQLPEPPDQQTPYFKLLPDGRFVRGPGSREFNIAAFINQQPGYIARATDEVQFNLSTGSSIDQSLTSAQVVERVALEYSVDPRLLLALLEYRAGWLSRPEVPEERITHPLISVADSAGVIRGGLYRQLAWAANELNRGYYNWRYRGATTLEFQDGLRLLYGPRLNAGTVGLQYFLSLNNTPQQWQMDVSQQGFYATYFAYFGDPFADSVDPLVPNSIVQPPLALPFLPGDTWFYTGGPHGGWGIGSAWSAIDLAPPDEREEGDALCYTSEYMVTAVAPGVIARSNQGSVVLDLDLDGDESTGWTILYLHLSDQDRVMEGTQVLTNDPIGRPSCEGGFSNATHLHIARRYNGEWLPADCQACPPGQEIPPFVMDGWQVIGRANEHYQGHLSNGTEATLTAEQGRLTTVNRIERPDF